MCKLTSKVRAGNALCATGSGGAVVSSSPMAATAAEMKGVIFLGLGWNELGILVAAVVGVAGLLFSQYWARERNRREEEARQEQRMIAQAQLAALAKRGCYGEQ